LIKCKNISKNKGKVKEVMNRSETRRVAFELLYSLCIQKLDVNEYGEQLEIFFENNQIEEEKTKDYIQDIVYGVEKNKKDILELINGELSEKWQLSRIFKVNLVILELAVYEILYKKLPYKVVVNEAVEIAKAYGDENASSFVNGILASIIKKNNIEEGATKE